MMNDQVTVVFGGPSPEHDISILTGLQCERVLHQAGVRVQALYWDASGGWHLIPAGTEARDYLDNKAPASATPAELRLNAEPGWYVRKGFRSVRAEVGVLLNCFHGGFGESGGAQALFAAMGIPATGSGAEASALGMDKYAFGAVMADAGLPTLPRVLLGPKTEIPFDGPYIVKPRFGGSSIGIEVVRDVEAARSLLELSVHLRQGAVVEPFRSDLFDLNIAFRTYPKFEASLLERPLRAGDAIYSYEEKYLQGSGLTSAPRELPAKVSEELAKTVLDLASEVARVTGLSGIVRTDFLSDGKEVFVNEVNSIPGAMALYLWPDGYTSKQLLIDMVEEAKATGRGRSGHGLTDGAALRCAGGISRKLAGIDAARSAAH